MPFGSMRYLSLFICIELSQRRSQTEGDTEREGGRASFARHYAGRLAENRTRQEVTEKGSIHLVKKVRTNRAQPECQQSVK